MTTRVRCPDQPTAQALAEAVDDAGHEVAVIAEQDATGETGYAVYTPAVPGKLAGLLPPGALVETY